MKPKCRTAMRTEKAVSFSGRPKKRKYITAFMMAGALAASLAGCQKKEAEVRAVAMGDGKGVEEISSLTESSSGAETVNSEDLITVGLSQLGAESDWRIANTESFKSTFTTDNGYYLIYDDAQQKQENQLKAIRNYILQEVDYIVLAPIVETGWDSALQEAKDAGIPVILADRKVAVEDEELYTSYVGANFTKEAEDAGKWLISYLESTGRSKDTINIVTLQGTPGASAELGRTEGFQKVMDTQPNWNMLEIRSADFTQAKGQEVMQYFLDTYDDIDVVISQNDNMAFGAIDAIEAAGKTCGPDGEIAIISFDAVSGAFDCMMEGTMNADFECNPLHGPRVDEIIQNLEAGRTVDKIQYVDETYFDTTMDLAKLKEGRVY